jgi:hypothetical protein
MPTHVAGRRLALSLLGLIAVAAVAEAKIAPPPPVIARMAASDAVVIGKVESIEEKTVDLPAYFGAMELTPHKIAIFKVDKGFLGAAGLTHVRVAFVPPVTPSRRPQLNLVAGEEYILYLSAVPKHTYYQAPGFYGGTAKKDNPTFTTEAAMVERSGKLLKDVKASLDSKNAQDGLLVAAALLHKYRRVYYSSGELKQVPIDAEESRKIMLVIADADWSKQDYEYGLGPQQLFYMLGATPNDGWVAPKNVQQFPDVAKKWLKDNAGKFQIKKFVPAGS